MAISLASDDWPVSDIAALVSILAEWSNLLQDHGESRPILDAAQMNFRVRLMRHDRKQRDAIVAHARRIRSFIDGGGDLRHPALGDPLELYFDALHTETWAIMGARELAGLGPSCPESDELIRLARARRDQWKVEDPLLTRVTQSFDQLVPDLDAGALAERLNEAIANDESLNNVHSAAWRLLQHAIKDSSPVRGEVRFAVHRAITRILKESRARGGLPLGAHAILANLVRADYSNRLGVSASQRLALLQLALENDPPREALAAIAELVLNTGDLTQLPHLNQEHRRLSERAAKFVFASRDHIATIAPELCAKLLATRALTTVNGGASSLEELSQRTQVAIASLAAASASEDRLAVVLALYAVAEFARTLHLDSAAALHAAVTSYLEEVSPPGLPLDVRAAMAYDAALTTGSPPTDPEADAESTLEERAVALAHARAADAAEANALWSRIAQLTEDLDDHERDEVTRARHLHAAMIALGTIQESGGKIDRKIAADLTRASLRVARSPQVPDSSLALPLLEYCVLGAVMADDAEVARSAIASFRSAVNERLIAWDSVALVKAIEMSGVIDDAARLAIVSGDVALGLLVAESGRAKLLAAVSTGLLAAHRPPPAAAEPLGVYGMPSVMALLDATLVEPPVDVIGAWRQLVSEVHWVDVVTALAAPWRPLISVREFEASRVFASSGTTLDARRAAMADPSFEEMLRYSTARRPVLWALGTIDDPIVVCLLPDGTAVVRCEAEDLDPVESASIDSLSEACFRGHRVWQHARAFCDDDAQIVLVDCARHSKVAFDMALGVWLGQVDGTTCPSGLLVGDPSAWSSASRSVARARCPTIVPSARFLRRERPARVAPKLDTFVLANPNGDLPGSLLEAAAWSTRADLNTAVAIGHAASVEQLVEALGTARTVVLSCHGHETADGATLKLADGVVSYADLLEIAGPVAAERLVLSCCWGGYHSVLRSRREALGLASSMLALGITEVLAPLEPLHDVLAATIGCAVARGTTRDRGLAQTFGAIRIALLRDGGNLDLSSWIDVVTRADRSSVSVQEDQLADLRFRLAAIEQAELYGAMCSYGVFGSGGFAE